jgi:hypothetical protein
MNRLAAWACGAIALVLVAVGTALTVAADKPLASEDAYSLVYVVVAGTVGALVASRHPRNPIGWILCGLTVWAGVDALARGVAEYLLAGEVRSQAWGERAAWVGSWSFVPFIFGPATVRLLLFPDGRLPSRRFRPVAWAAALVIAFWIVATAIEPGRLENFDSVVNPFGIDAPALALASDLVAPLMFVCILASVGSVIARTRRATSLEREQLKWLAFASCFAVATKIIGAVVSSGAAIGSGFFSIAVLSLPLAMGVAILRYRLYDIDVVISQTLVYVPLIAIIGGVSTALIPLSQRVFHGLTGSDSDATIVVTALLVAALVAPVRKRLEAMVERRFKLKPEPSGNAKELLEDPAFVALVESIAERAAREAVRQLESRRT